MVNHEERNVWVERKLYSYNDFYYQERQRFLSTCSLPEMGFMLNFGLNTRKTKGL